MSPTGYSEPLHYALFFIGAFGPFVGAFSLTYLNEEKEGVKKLWNRFWDFKVEKKWLLTSLLFFPAFYGVSYVIAHLIQGKSPVLVWVSQPSLLISYLTISFLGGGFCEEFGWRGYALDRLQSRYNAFTSSLILGVVWGFWHIPLWFIVGDSHSAEGLPMFFLFLLDILFLSVLFTWLYNNTGRSILPAVVLHTMHNFMTKLNLISGVSGPIYIILFYLTTIIVVIKYGRKSLVISR